MSHTITITKKPDEVDDDWEWTKGGTCDNSCRLWGPGDDGPDKDADNVDVQVIGSVEWRRIDGEWMHRTGRCVLDELGDDIADELAYSIGAENARVGGTYPVECDYEGDGDWTFIIDPHEEAADHE